MFKKDSFWDNPYGGIFDFNGDGKEDFCEQYYGFELYEQTAEAEAEETELASQDDDKE